MDTQATQVLLGLATLAALLSAGVSMVLMISWILIVRRVLDFAWSNVIYPRSHEIVLRIVSASEEECTASELAEKSGGLLRDGRLFHRTLDRMLREGQINGKIAADPPTSLSGFKGGGVKIRYVYTLTHKGREAAALLST